MKELETKEDFDAFLKESGGKLVVIDFFADWCGPCKVIAPKLLVMEGEFKDVNFAKVNVDTNDESAEEHEVSAMPTFIFFKNGKNVGKIVGANESELRKKITELK